MKNKMIIFQMNWREKREKLAQLESIRRYLYRDKDIEYMIFNHRELVKNIKSDRDNVYFELVIPVDIFGFFEKYHVPMQPYSNEDYKNRVYTCCLVRYDGFITKEWFEQLELK